MSAHMISQDVIDSILRAHDILDTISQYVKLAKKGKNYSGLCPFHGEKTPSFSVNPEMQRFKCFGCGVGGNLIHFHMRITGNEFLTTCRELADAAGISVPSLEREPVRDEQWQMRQHALAAHRLATDLYHHILMHTEQGKAAREYLLSRGFKREQLEQFQVGYAPNLSGEGRDVLTKILRKHELPLALIADYGLIKFQEQARDYSDRFFDRIMFPIANDKGETVAFGGRLLADRTDQPKYLNSQESPIFHKSQLLYNLHLAKPAMKTTQQVVICEGYVDLIKMWSAGITNVVATLGTALTNAHAQVLARTVNQVTLCFDADAAGQTAANRSIDLLATHSFTVRVAVIPDGCKDPDDFITRFGGDAFQRQVTQPAIAATRYKLQFIRKKYRMQDDTDKLQYLREALAIIATLRTPTERELYLQYLADDTAFSIHTIKQEFQDVLRVKMRKTEDSSLYSLADSSPPANNKQVTLLPAYHKAERTLLAMMIESPQMTMYIMETLGDQFHIPEHLALAAHLYAYYSKHSNANPNAFLFELDDERLLLVASELMMDELPPDCYPESKATQDLIREVKKRALQLELSSLQEQLVLCERAGIDDQQQFMASVQLTSQIIDLKKQLLEFN